MHAAGVVCSDCHDTHSANLHVEGNALCGQCHRANVYDTPEHHFHDLGTEGSLCTDCHMPQRTYMVNDDRADHRFGSPRPVVICCDRRTRCVHGLPPGEEPRMG